MSRYTTPTTVVIVRLHLVSAAWNVLLASAIREAIEPIITFVGGMAAVGSAVGSVREWSKDEPQWDQAMGMGAVGGALLGAALLVLDAFFDR